jgi:hypothetical protein
LSSEEVEEQDPEPSAPPKEPVARPVPRKAASDSSASSMGLDLANPVFPSSVPKPPPGIFREPLQVDKYFGSKLPPACRQLGCFVTDNGRFFYCINPNCHKDKKRETKYNRRKKSIFYFACPKCKSRDIQLHLRRNEYQCLGCAFAWKK